MSIQVKFFASLRELTGVAEMSLDIAGVSVAEVWASACDGITMPPNTLAALNMEYVSMQAAVADGDEVAFFPPVTGGDL